jgi:hexosaminidase
MSTLSLLPQPRQLSELPEVYAVASGRRILIEGAEASMLLPMARRLQEALRVHAGVAWELTATSEGPLGEIGVALRVQEDASPHAQGYALSIRAEQISIEAPTAVGVFYGVCTLIQILEQAGRQLPGMQISDWPDFDVRGVMLDISRDKVPTMETLYGLIDMLARWKINQLQLYTEHTFAYHNHPDVWARASPITGEEILLLDAYCRERWIELVPNQNTFGHMTRWLTHERYAGLAETHDWFDTPWNIRLKGPYSLAPEDPGSLELIQSLFDELLPHFSSRMVNIGCDETIDLGQGRSKVLCEERGRGRVYLDFLLQVYHLVSARSHVTQFWGDIITEHPELIPELPRDAIALEWGYDAKHPFAEHCPQFAASGVPFYVCPGTSSWNSLAGRTDNAIANIRSAAENGLAHGAIGLLNTDWGDNGHWQMLPVSFLGFAAGAAFAWAYQANRDIDMARAVSLHAFDDPTGAMGRVAYDLGNVYQAAGFVPGNASALFWLLQEFPGEWLTQPETPRLDLAASLAAIDAAMQPIGQARMRRPDAAIITQEYEHTARLLRHACRLGQLTQDAGAEPAGSAARRKLLDEDLREIIREYERLWLARNRPGGLADSVARLERLRATYRK